MKNYLGNWNIVRMLRLAMGILIIVQGFRTEAISIIILGGLFSLMPLLNVGCCSTAGCNMPVRKNSKQAEDITYEEVLPKHRQSI